ncbi:MAG: TonB-dependent receptor, partial [Bacteroidia bacterium]|nr:TonB-dependent receptor [Bacteroidia bacterium]
GVYSNTLTNSTHPTFFPGIDFGWVLMDNLKLYSSISKGMRLPTYTDLYYKGTNTTGNAQLVAEAAVSSEVGVKYFHKNGSFSITGFSRNSTNLIDWVRKDTSEKWQAHNLGHVVFNGIESNVSLKLNKFISSIQLGYTFIDVGLKQVENYQSNYALSNLRHQLTAMVLVNWNKNIVHTITYKHIERELLPNYSLVDSKIMYLFKYAGVFAEVSNIFNTSYIEAGFVEMPGRWVKIGANLKLNFK